MKENRFGPLLHWLAAVLILGALGPLSGCLSSADLDRAAFQVYRPIVEAVKIGFALELYWAKNQRLPATLAEANQFLAEQNVPLSVDPAWTLQASITDGICNYTATQGKQTQSGQFSVKDLDYQQTLARFLKMQEAKRNFDPIFKSAGVTTAAAAPVEPPPVQHQSR